MIGVLVLFVSLLAVSHSHTNVLIDISTWQPDVDFKLVKADGIAGVIHKATEGQDFVDKTYRSRRPEAEAAGLLWGAYHFGVGGVSGKVQADHFLSTVGDWADVVLALDHESNPRGQTMGLQEAEDFVLRVRNVTGRFPFIYGSTAFLSAYSSNILNQCPLWVAHWTEEDSPTLPKGKDAWVFWQYTDGQKGGTPRAVGGIGHCDRDRYNGALEQLRKKWPHF